MAMRPAVFDEGARFERRGVGRLRALLHGDQGAQELADGGGIVAPGGRGEVEAAAVPVARAVSPVGPGENRRTVKEPAASTAAFWAD